MSKATGWVTARTLAGCGVVACLALPGAAPGTAATPVNAARPTTLAAAAPARAAAAAAQAAVPGRLYSVAAVSANDAWAVGLDPQGTLIMHWNGAQWSRYPLSRAGYFIGVAARSASDAWAVGGTNWFTGSQTLAMHWNGRSWTRVPAPTPGGGGLFTAVAATSSRNAWAVGLAGPGPGTPSPVLPLIEHWNGRHWSVQPVAALPDGGSFSGVAALSPSNAWAVGETGLNSEGTGQRTLIEHWDGTSWTRVASPDQPGASAGYLRQVTVIAAGNAWAVGAATMPDGRIRTLTAFWDGRRWRQVPSPTPGGDAELLGVTASWRHNIWAVGMTSPSGCGPCRTLIMHWNGVRWKVLPSPNPPGNYYLYTLFGIAAVARDDIWAAGTTGYASTLIVHWNGSAWS